MFISEVWATVISNKGTFKVIQSEENIARKYDKQNSTCYRKIDQQSK